jgi:hypothetical protein
MVVDASTTRKTAQLLSGRGTNVLLKLGRIALLVGAILIVSALIVDNTPIYLGGAVQYPGQAVAIAKRSCGATQPDLLKNTSLPWRAWLLYDDMRSAYVWNAGFDLPHDGWCLLLIDPRTGEVLEARIGAV